MNTETKELKELILDLAKLLKKYGPDPFIKLSQFINSEEGRRSATVLIREIVSWSNEVSPGREPSTEDHLKKISDKISDLEKTDPERAKVIRDICRILFADRNAPSLARVKKAIAKVSPEIIPTRSRKDVSMHAINLLIDLPPEDVESFKKGNIQQAFTRRIA